MGYMNLLMLMFLFNISFAVLMISGNDTVSEKQPEFLETIRNQTVTQSFSARFFCVVNDLGKYNVAWINVDKQSIVAIGKHKLTDNKRISISHDGNNTWLLTIRDAQLSDSGSYMCQINTDPIQYQVAYLYVVQPPDIVNNSTVNEVANVGGKVQLVCRATGVPEPAVQWRRENGKDIIIRTEGHENKVVKFFDGDSLVLNQVQRSDIGRYLCLASNGVLPSVSKRFDVQVNFPPNVRAVNQLVNALVETEVQLQCIVEAFPDPLTGWYKDNGMKLNEAEKYIISEKKLNTYTWLLNLIVKSIGQSDFGTFICSSTNLQGKSDAKILLQELRLAPTP